MKKKFKTIKIDEKTFNLLDDIVKVLGVKKSGLINELIDCLASIVAPFGTANVKYEIQGTQLTITASGKNIMLGGVFQSNESDEAVEARINAEIKASIKKEKLEALVTAPISVAANLKGTVVVEPKEKDQ